MVRILTSLILIVCGLLLNGGQAWSQRDTDNRLSILQLMGAEGRFVIPSRKQQTEIFRQFNRLDIDEDGLLSRTEFSKSDDQLPMDVQDRIFLYADIDRNKLLTHEEFAEHIVVLDEARAIFAKIDLNNDLSVNRQEFNAINETEMAENAFPQLDINADDVLALPEFLTRFCEWSRLEQPPVTARLIAKQKTYPLPAEYQTKEFRSRIRSETDIEKLPPVPAVNLVLVIKNVSDKPVTIWPGGSIDEATVTVTGDGLVRPDNLQGGGGSSSGTTPQPVIQPGKAFRVRIRSLNLLENFIDNAYWTRPGEYQISASYPVFQNLPPHLPELFPNQPKITGKPKRFQVVAPPVTVVVVNEE